MAHTDDIRADVLENVARQIADFVDRGLEKELIVEGPPPDAPNDIGDEKPLWVQDSLLVYKLSREALHVIRDSRAEGDLGDWVTPTGQSYHQIFLKGEAKAFARSLMPEGESQEVVLCQLSVSPLARRVEDAFNIIKEREKKETQKKLDGSREYDEVLAANPVVRLLDLPSYHIFALWLYAEALRRSRILVVVAPQRFGGEWAGSFLTTAQFFERLKNSGPLTGTA